MWGCFLMSGVKILHFLKDWWKSIPIHQNYSMALSDVGVGGTALQWFHSYLSSRSQSVQIRDTSSPSTALNFSVPQGSVLSPHLFNIYTLPLQNIIAKHNIKFHMYTDDLQLYFTCSPVQEEIDKCLESLQTCIIFVSGWVTVIWIIRNLIMIRQSF